EQTLPHRRRRPPARSEGPEAAPLDGCAGGTLARGDDPELLLEARQLLALPFLELRELALSLVVEALEGARPRAVETLHHLGDRPHHAEGGDERAQAVRAAEDRTRAIGGERHRVLPLAPEATDGHLPLLRRRDGEAGRRLFCGGGGCSRRGSGRGRRLRS